MQRLKPFLLGFLLLTLTACGALKETTFVHDGYAIRGYDTVAYHTGTGPLAGSSAYTHEYNGAIWRFANQENLDLFRENPARYAPQYGGYCAHGMSKGYAVSTDPNAWHVVDNKLYLNYSLGVRRTWLKDVPGNVSKADDNWQKKLFSGS